MKISLCICTNREIKPQTVESLLNLVNGSKHELHIVMATRGYNTAESRNYCVVQAQKNNSEYLLFIDDDMTFLPDTLDRLLADNKDIVGVNSYSRCLPLASTVGLMNEKGEYMHPDKYPAFEMQIPDVLFKAYFVGTGIMLIKMSVFEKIKKPYFDFKMAKNGMMLHGEDGTFCAKAQKAGVDVWCNPTLDVGHLGLLEYSSKLRNTINI